MFKFWEFKRRIYIYDLNSVIHERRTDANKSGTNYARREATRLGTSGSQPFTGQNRQAGSGNLQVGLLFILDHFWVKLKKAWFLV